MSDTVFQRNMRYAVPAKSYITILPSAEEAQFQSWANANHVPFDPSPQADYDMRGFWKGLMAHDPRAETNVNANDRKLHYSDYWKTPYHKSFSRESKWATQAAPAWNEKDQLVLPDGSIVFDEKQAMRAQIARELQPQRVSIQRMQARP